jgi:hypothetical protein
MLVDPGDGSVLQAILFKPDPILFPGPRPCCVGTHSPGFQYDALASLTKVFAGLPGNEASGLAGNGVICLAGNVRGCAANGTIAPGQTTTGAWHQQTDDYKQLVRYMRQGAEVETVHGLSVTGFVGSTGGSGAAHHALYAALDGTAGDDKSDAAICMSTVTDMGDRDNVSAGFITLCTGYGNSTDLAVLTSESPIALNLALAKAIFMANGDAENMPLSNLTRFRDAMLALGATEPQFINRILTGSAGHAHAFAEWQFIFAESIPWFLARAAEFDGNPPPPPPPPTGRYLVTAAITGLSPGLTLDLNVSAIDDVTGLEGPSSAFEFISDRAGSGGGGGGPGKDAPAGVYALVNAVDGVIVGDYTTRAWKSFAYVDGACFPSTWAALNPTSKTSFDWTAPDTFVQFCGDNGKQAAISVDCGIKSPPWIFVGAHPVEGFNEGGPHAGKIPVQWNPNYLPVLKGFIKAFAARFDANPALSYVVVAGMGQLLDTLLVQAGPDYTNLNNLAVAAGFTDLITAWNQTSAQILDFWAKAFVTTNVILPINLPVPSVNGGLDGINQFSLTSIQSYRSHFGLSSLELDGLTASGADLSINKIIHDATQSQKGYRFRRPSSDPECDPSQSGIYDAELGLQNAAGAGITVGVQFEEFYEEDILKVTNNYPTHFASFQTSLKANAV